MRLTIAAIGKLKRGAEAELAARYLERAEATGKALGFTIEVRELPEGRGERALDRMAREAEALRGLIPDRAAVILLDERGKSISSTQFADALRRWRDEGRRDVVLVIGGPDGLDASLRAAADITLAFGATTWPHQLVRVMLAEQVYRALTIISGHPYHRA